MKQKIIILSFLSLLTGICKNKICQNCQFFSGQMPANFSREKLNKIDFKEYLILEKSNGFRFLFLMTTFFYSYFIDRNLLIHKTNCLKNKKNAYLKKGTIYDGEISFNLIKEEFDFIIYDILCYENDWRISTWDLIARINILNKIKKKINLTTWKKNNLKKKDFFLKKNLQIIFDQICPNYFSNEFVYLNKNLQKTYICNKNDGIIFTHSKSIYFTKYPTNIFKWKYEKDNSLDLFSKNFPIPIFKKKIPITISKLFCQGFYNNLIYIKKGEGKFFFQKFFFFLNNENKTRIKEYVFDKKRGKWVNIKNRPDKKKPNSFKLILNTLENIIEIFLKFEFIDRNFKQNLRKNRGKIFLEDFFFFSGV